MKLKYSVQSKKLMNKVSRRLFLGATGALGAVALAEFTGVRSSFDPKKTRNQFIFISSLQHGYETI